MIDKFWFANVYGRSIGITPKWYDDLTCRILCVFSRSVTIVSCDIRLVQHLNVLRHRTEKQIQCTTVLVYIFKIGTEILATYSPVYCVYGESGHFFSMHATDRLLRFGECNEAFDDFYGISYDSEYRACIL